MNVAEGGLERDNRRSLAPSWLMRGLYFSSTDAPDPLPPAYPQHLDVRLDGKMVPLDVLVRDGVTLAEATFTDACRELGSACS